MVSLGGWTHPRAQALALWAVATPAVEVVVRHMGAARFKAVDSRFSPSTSPKETTSRGEWKKEGEWLPGKG